MKRDYTKILEILSNYGLSPKVEELFDKFEQTAYYSNGMDDYDYAEQFDVWFDTRPLDDNLYEGKKKNIIHAKKWDRCTEKVKKQDRDMESAATICSSSIKNDGVKSTYQRKRGKQYYTNRKKSETNEGTGTGAASGQYSGPFMKPIKRTIKEALESAYDGGAMVTNEMLEKELGEGMGTTQVTTGSYEQPAIWAKNSKNMKFNKKTTWPGGSFVSIKEKCRKFPYCNQGDTEALNFSNPKAAKNNQLSENNDIYNKDVIMGTANKLKLLEKKLFESYLDEKTITELDSEANEAHLKLPLRKKRSTKRKSNRMKETKYGDYFDPESDDMVYGDEKGEPTYEKNIGIATEKDYELSEIGKFNKKQSNPRADFGKFNKKQSNPIANNNEIEEVVNDELMRMYEVNFVNRNNGKIEDNRNDLNESQEPGISAYMKAHKKSGENNKAANKVSMDNAARLNKQSNKTEEEKLSNIGKGAPKYGNFDKEKFEDESEDINILRGNGLEDLQFDTEPAEDYKKRAEEAIIGSAKMGNDPNYANAMRDFDGNKGDLGQRIIKTAKKKNKLKNKADNRKNTSMDIELPSKGEKFIASENKVKYITIDVKEPIYYYKDIEQFLTEECKKDGQEIVVIDSNGTKFSVVWEGNNYYVASETNELIKESELNYMQKMMGYRIGHYNKKPKPMKK